MRLRRKNKNDIENTIAELWEKASQLNKLGRYKEAIDIYDKLLMIVRQNFGESNEYYARLLNNLGLIYHRLGNYNRADRLYKEAQEASFKVLSKVLGESHRGADGLYTGENQNELLSILSGASDVQDNIGRLRQEIGDYKSAESDFQKALETRLQIFLRTGEEHAKYVTSLNNLATMYFYNLGKFSQAERLYIEALDVLSKVGRGKEDQYYAIVVNNLGLMYQHTSNYSQAERLYIEALEVHRKAGRENHYYGQSLHNLASLYNLQGNYSQAEPLYIEALEVERKAGRENHTNYALALSELASLYAATSRKIKALDLLQESVSVEDKIVDQTFSITSDRERLSFIRIMQRTFSIFLSLVFQQFSKDQQAIQNALNLVMKRKSIAAEAIILERELSLTEKYPQLEPTVDKLNNIRRQIAQRSLDGPLPEERREKYQQNLEELNSEKEQLEEILAPQVPKIQIQQSLRTINSKALSKALPDGRALIEFVRFNNYNFEAISAQGDLQKQQQGIPRYLAFILNPNEPGSVQMIDLGDAGYIDTMVTRFRMSIIEGRGASVQYSEEENQDNDSRHLAPLGTPGSSLDPKLGHHLNNNTNNNNASWTDTGYELYKLIFHPLLSAIGENCKKLFIAPDGDLSRLPFEVLPTNENGRTNLLIDNYSITYLTTARDILRISKKMPAGLPNEPIVAADPDFDLDSNSTRNSANIANNNIHTNADNTTPIEKDFIIKRPIISNNNNRLSRDFDRNTITFNRLEGTKYEGEEISKLLGIQPWMEENVLESKLKSFRSPRILHIATHGFFLANQGDLLHLFDRLSGQDMENPMLRSGLALAGANTWISRQTLPEEAEDGILTAEDVSMMDLTNTELVVLSACETGLGQVLKGEGVIGLRRSFVLAGAKTLVMSLWKVPDEQTKELMVDFYKRLLLSGKPRAEALREAQLAMKDKYPNPYYWGAFICQGNPDPMLNKV